MNSGLTASNPALEAAFRAALLSQGTLAFLTFVLLAIAWVACREALLARDRPRLVAHLAGLRASRLPEPAARRLLRIGFGALWILDGLLQAQPTMPGGLPSQVISPAAAGSPHWVLDVVNWAGTSWSEHPVQAAAAAVWIQLGIGIWLVASGSPRWSRLAGLVSAGWGLVVWVFGEAFGSMLAPGQSWLMGAPGAALFYCIAGVLLALPLRCYRDPQLGGSLLRVAGLGLIGFATLQAWPGRGFWQGRSGARPGSLSASVADMAALKQPALLHRVVTWSAVLIAGHGVAINLIIVIAMAGIGAALLTGRLNIVRPAVAIGIAFCLASWILVQDLGVFGGLGTDPNSMLPQALLLAAGLLAMSRPATDQAGQPRLAGPAPGALRAVTAPSLGGPAGQPAEALAASALGPPANGRLHAALSPPAAGEASPSLAPPGDAAAITARTAHLTRLGALSRLRPGRVVRGLSIAFGSSGTSAVLALWAGAIVLLGAAPLAMVAAR